MKGVAATLERCARARDLAFTSRDEQSWVGKLILSFTMACMTGVAAQVRIPLGFTDVPLTGQTFAVLLAGMLLGGGWGAASQVIYIALGAAGLPWFQGMGGGIGVLGGPTSGYLMGFVPAAMLAGWAAGRYRESGRRLPLLAALVSATVLILACGSIYLAWGLGRGLGIAVVQGFVPFLMGDVLKAAAAASIAIKLLPRKP